ncbi:MAG TPA: hypothetical protein VGM79_17225 [Streptosporangiaceae bacterium]
MLAGRYFEHLLSWLESRHLAPAPWQHAAHFGDTTLYVTAGELAELAEQERARLARFGGRVEHPELCPPGARQVAYLHLAFPGDLSGAAPGGDAGT